MIIVKYGNMLYDRLGNIEKGNRVYFPPMLLIYMYFAF